MVIGVLAIFGGLKGLTGVRADGEGLRVAIGWRGGWVEEGNLVVSLRPSAERIGAWLAPLPGRCPRLVYVAPLVLGVVGEVPRGQWGMFSGVGP